MPRVTITPHVQAADGSSPTITWTTTDHNNDMQVAYEPGMIILFRNGGTARTAVLTRSVRGVDVAKTVDVPANSGANNGVAIITDLEPAEWVGADGMLRIDPSASDFSVAAIKRRRPS